MPSNGDIPLQRAYQDHARQWQHNRYCYPVVSRRSGGLSIGVNLNPDKACNFDCIYCQVDRNTAPAIRKVDLDIVRDELDSLIQLARDGQLWQQAPFDAVPEQMRVIQDIAFSGDGEPTTYPRFDKAVQLAADLRQQHALTDTKIVLITDACYLTRPTVERGLAIMDHHNGEIWAKLDAGTEAYYQEINRPNYPLQHVLDNILAAARLRPVVIQSLWMRVHGQPPPNEEVMAFCQQLSDIINQDGQIKLVQLYTIARQTTEAYATMLSNGELDDIAAIVRSNLNVPIEVYYGVE